ncbi:MAG TPA: MFS transporter [Actinotalea sp.]|nr:MFS transporter [Actinotalea sp.]
MRPGPEQQTRIWTRDFVLVTVVNLLVMLAFFVLVITMAAYAADRFAASDSGAGLASSSVIIGALVARPFTGRYLERIGRRRVLLGSLVLFAIVSPLYLVASSLTLLILVRLLHGMAFGALNTAISTSVMGLVPPLRRAEGVGYFTLSGTLATAVAPFVALGVLGSWDHDVLFVVCTALAVVALVLAGLLRLPAVGRPGAGQESGRRSGLAGFIEPTVLPIASVMLVVGVAFSGVMTYVPLYATQLDLVAAGGMFFFVYSMAILVTRPFVGRLHDVRGDNAVVYPALGAFAIGLGLLSVATSSLVLLLAAGFVGFGMGTLMAAAQVIAVSVAPAHHVGLATSTFFVMLDLGSGGGPLLLGLMIAAAGFDGMYQVLAVVVALSAGLYHLTHGRRRRGVRDDVRRALEEDDGEPVAVPA